MTWRRVFFAVGGAAVLFRLVMALFFVSSPFRYFHTVPGLDMQTLLRFGEWGAPGNSFFFTPHRLAVWLIWRFNSGVHAPGALIAVQALLGVLLALAVADTARLVWRSRFAALTAGLLMALNPVELMYEFTTLQDSMVTAGAFFAFWALLRARRRHFAPWTALGAGALAGIAAVGRPAALPLALLCFGWCAYYVVRRRLPWRRAAFYGGGLLAVWLVCAAVNAGAGGKFNCFFNPVPYTVAFNTGVSTPTPTPTPKNLWNTGLKMLQRLPRLFHPVELPENLNIYFLREQLPPLRVPFEFLTSLAAVLLLFLLIGKALRRDGVILLPLAALALVLCVRDPIGRYRLMLLPYFALSAAFLCVWRSVTLRWGVFAVLVMAVIGDLTLTTPERRPLRAADWSAWGWALEAEAGHTTPEALESFRRAWCLKPDDGAAVNVLTRAIALNDAATARRTIAEGVAAGKTNPSLLHYYGGLIALPDGAQAEREFEQVDPGTLPPPLPFRYYFVRGEARRLRNDRAGAAKFFRRALSIPGGDAHLRRRMNEFLSQPTGEKKP